MSKFLQEMGDRGLVQLAELSKGVLSFTGLSTEHEWYYSLILAIFSITLRVSP